MSLTLIEMKNKSSQHRCSAIYNVSVASLCGLGFLIKSKVRGRADPLQRHREKMTMGRVNKRRKNSRT